jgi:hypothetical protein
VRIVHSVHTASNSLSRELVSIGQKTLMPIAIVPEQPPADWHQQELLLIREVGKLLGSANRAPARNCSPARSTRRVTARTDLS